MGGLHYKKDSPQVYIQKGLAKAISSQVLHFPGENSLLFIF